MPTPVWDPQSGQLRNGERVAQFSGKQELLLKRLADGRIHCRDVLMDDLYGDDPLRYPKTPTILDMHLLFLRQRLRPFGILIENCRGHGWRLYQPLARAAQIE